LIMALAVSLIISYFLYNRMKRQYALNSRPVQIVAAAKQLDPGTVIQAEDLTAIDWPANFPLQGSFTKAQDVVGRVAVLPIAIKEPVREPLLATAGAVGLTTKIPEGMRAVAVDTNDVTNVAGFLYPGARVDVLVTFQPEAGKNGGQEWMTSTVLQNTEVLSTGERLAPDPSGKPQKVRQVTLLLSPEDAQKLVLASTQGTIRLILRNGADQEQADHRPVVFKDFEITSVPKPTPVVARKAAAPPAKPKAAYEVEVFDGTKRAVQKF
jgi:pilus assembly protein CpaB